MSPKRLMLVVTTYGLGFGCLAVWLHPSLVHALRILLGFGAGMAYAATLLAVLRHRRRSKGFGLDGTWFGLVLVLTTATTLLGLGMESFFATGGYGLTLWLSLQVREWRGSKPLDWQDTKELLKGGDIRRD